MDWADSMPGALSLLATYVSMTTVLSTTDVYQQQTAKESNTKYVLSAIICDRAKPHRSVFALFKDPAAGWVGFTEGNRTTFWSWEAAVRWAVVESRLPVLLFYEQLPPEETAEPETIGETALRSLFQYAMSKIEATSTPQAPQAVPVSEAPPETKKAESPVVTATSPEEKTPAGEEEEKGKPREGSEEPDQQESLEWACRQCKAENRLPDYQCKSKFSTIRIV